MKRLIQVVLLFASVLISGCVAPQAKIASERLAYLSDPSIPRNGYDGQILKGGEQYRFLFENDLAFGDYLLTVVPSARDARIAVAALTFFAWKKPDRVKFDAVVRVIDPALLRQEVDLGGGDVISMVPLSEWIANTRKSKNWANNSPEPTPGSVTPAASAPAAPPPGAAGL
jgi:hypothetical protein